MKQYIDKAAVVAEIERRRKEWSYGSSIEAKYKREECDDFLYFLDNLEVKEVEEVPVSKDLDDAARSYSDNIDNICGSVGEQTRNAFKLGANWQEEQMIDKACEWLKEQDEMVGVSFEEDFIERFKNYMKGE